MIKRTIEISQLPAYVSVSMNQLQIRRENEVVGTIPCEDIGMLVVDQPQTTYSHAALVRLAENDAAVVVCGRNHLPVALLLPLSTHTEVVWRLSDQIELSKPVGKRLWQQIVQAKIIAQSENLNPESAAHQKLRALAKQVRSGDPANIEAQAARVYWANWLGPDSGFRRDTDGEGINAFLNYGYAVVRAALARAIVAAGFLPALGLKHSNRSNSFALCDDLIEPLRPMVDARVAKIASEGKQELTQTVKAELIQVTSDEVEFDGQTGPLMVSLHRYIALLGKCYRGEESRLVFPKRIRVG